ncbi:MAG: hypothetical protein EA417_04150 [Gammaproteobacteria bacterium]|nr:MAG: hypothetical protein EA417_04150 [Gammaproteobacteria bacterium]
MLRALALLVLLVNLALLLWGSSRGRPEGLAPDPPPLPPELPSLVLLSESEHPLVERRDIDVPAAGPCLRFSFEADREALAALALAMAAVGHDATWLQLDDQVAALELRPGEAGLEGWSEERLVALAEAEGLLPEPCREEEDAQLIAPPAAIP